MLAYLKSTLSAIKKYWEMSLNIYYICTTINITIMTYDNITMIPNVHSDVRYALKRWFKPIIGYRFES